jgi:hypothetical protein
MARSAVQPVAAEPAQLALQLAAVVATLARIEVQQAGIAAEVAVLRLRVEGKVRRDAVLRELAGRLDLGRTTLACANAVTLILSGIRQPPPGAEAAVAALAGTQLSARQVLRILKAGVEAETADKSRAFCQSWPARDHGGTATEEDHDDAP